ncbi:MAG: capsular polysaccharide biosynthesis protein [Ruminococcaceae bacterium]|nr:capsular polysaccharide biosynthesis protein [Oscillospiraceae bacterium]
MLDFHSHILPEIDDGAQSVEESIAMLKMLKEQGVTTVALTSHYLAMDESPEMFLERRAQSFEILKNAIDNKQLDLPDLMLGAEVYYYPGICKMEELSTLTLEGTNLLLLEMPMARWSEYTIRELEELYGNTGIRIVIAHIERCIDYQKKETLERLFNSGVATQVNASFFISKRTRRKALKMFKLGHIGFIGTDCHNLKYRPPKMNEALQIIHDCKQIPNEVLDDFIKNQKDNLYP